MRALSSAVPPLLPNEQPKQCMVDTRQSAALRSCAVAAGALLWIGRAAPGEGEEEPRPPVRGARAIVAGINGHRERERERDKECGMGGWGRRQTSIRSWSVELIRLVLFSLPLPLFNNYRTYEYVSL